MVVWLAIEVTGLDPEMDDVLEAALVYRLPGATADTVLHFLGPASLAERAWKRDPALQKMHTDSGLLDALRAPVVEGVDADRVDVESAVYAALHALSSPQGRLCADRRPIVLAGRSVHVDRSFIQPDPVSVSSRHLDISALSVVRPDLTPSALPGFRTHRAVSGLLQDIHAYDTCYRPAMGLADWRTL